MRSDAVAICVVLVGVYVGVISIVAATVGVYVGMGVGGPSIMGEDSLLRTPPSDPILRLWTDNNGFNSNTVLYKDIIEAPIDAVIKSVVLHYPTIDPRALREILTYNMEGYYGLYK